MHEVCIFQNKKFVPDNLLVLIQTMCRTHADFADLVQTLCRLSAHFFKKVCVLQTMQTFWKVCMSAKIWHADFMHTFSIRCKVCIKSPTRASKPSRNLGIQHDASAQSAYRLSPSRAPAPTPPPPPCWPWGCCRRTMPTPQWPIPYPPFHVP